CDEPVLVSPGEFLRIRTGLRMRCTIGIAFEGDGGDADGGTRGKPFLQFVIFLLAFRQAKPPAVIVNDDGNVVRVVESRCAAIEGGIVEVPFRGSKLPDE